MILLFQFDIKKAKIGNKTSCETVDTGSTRTVSYISGDNQLLFMSMLLMIWRTYQRTSSDRTNERLARQRGLNNNIRTDGFCRIYSATRSYHRRGLAPVRPLAMTSKGSQRHLTWSGVQVGPAVHFVTCRDNM